VKRFFFVTVLLLALSTIMTTFFADLPGAYTISLVVSNGTTSSSPDTVVVTATGP
jgi:hypothetical protein